MAEPGGDRVDPTAGELAASADPGAGPGREGGEEPGLEARLRRLEQIVSALEADELELERALSLFEEGVAHVRAAEAILSETELKVEELLGEGDDAGTRPFRGAEQG